MFRNRPTLAKVVSVIAVLLYLGVLYLIVAVLAKPATPNNSLFGSLLGSNNSSNSDIATNRYTPQLIRTADSGKTWQTPNPVEADELPSFADITCMQPDKCYAIGFSSGSIYESTDGGKKWVLRQSSDKTRIQKISCTRTGCIASGYDRSNDVFLSSADGQNWVKFNAGTAPRDLLDIACPTTEICFAVGKEGRILKSADSGKNWVLQEAGVGRTFNAVSCSSAANCVIVGQVGTVLVTENGGQNWTKQSFGYAKNLTALKCPTATFCLALGGTFAAGEILRSTDGGKKWETLKIGSTAQEGYSKLNCPTAQNCFVATGTGKILTTADAGQNWTSQSPPIAKSFMGLSCPTATDCIALALSYSYTPGDEYEYDYED